MVGAPLAPRPPTDNDRETILLPIVGGLTELTVGRPGLFIDRPGFIAGPTPDTLLAQTVQSISRLNCRVWASNDKSNYSQNVNQQNATLCGPYLDSLGEQPTDGDIEEPFAGGQCPGTTYFVEVTGTVIGSPDQTFGANLVGPLRYNEDLEPIPDPTGCSAGSTWNRFSIAGSNPSPIITWVGCGATLTINTIMPLFGGPDNCGNPPVVVRPPSTVTPVTPIPPSITVNLPGLGDVEVTVNLDPNGDPIICVPDLDVCVTVPFTIDGGDDGGGGGGGGGAPPGDVGDPGGTEGTGDGGEAEGEAPAGNVLTGLRVDIVTVPSSAREYQTGVYRAVCYAYLGTNEGLDLDPAGSLLETGQFIFAEKDNLTKWKVVANVGFNLNITPYYREVE